MALASLALAIREGSKNGVVGTGVGGIVPGFTNPDE